MFAGGLGLGPGGGVVNVIDDYYGGQMAPQDYRLVAEARTDLDPVYAGTRHDLRFSAPAAFGDIAGAKIWFTLRSHDGAVAVRKRSEAAGGVSGEITLLSPTTDRNFDVSITVADIEDLGGDYEYEIRMERTGYANVTGRGSWQILPSISDVSA